MRQINLNGVFYPIVGDIIRRGINPWKAAIASATREYSSFQNCDLEEYHDFRNGIGLESALPAESARLWWTEGIDFSTPRSAVLGPLVNTAGSFDVAPVKIIDFQSYTYGIGAGVIKKWDKVDTWDSAWASFEICDCDEAWDSSAGANVVCSADTTDKKEGASSAKMAIADAAGAPGEMAKETITSVNLTTKTQIGVWIKSSVALNANDFQLELWDAGGMEEQLNIPETAADTWVQHLLTLAAPEDCTAIISVRLRMAVDKGACDIHLDFIAAVPLLTGSPIDAIVVTDATDEYIVVSSALDAIYSVDGAIWLNLVGCKGYLAFYDTKLHGINTDGGTLNSSAANNVDGTWTTTSLSGDFGTIYDLFEGKLLADGTPCLYMCGNEGLFTIDITNAKAYKQEVAYPPLTYAGHKGLYWNANVWVATGFGILKVTPSMATFVGPDLDDGLPSTYQGSIFDMVTVNNWLIFCVNKTASTDKSSILKRNSSYGGNLQVYTSAADTAIACLHHSPSSLYTNGRLWFGEGTDIKYMMFPDTTSNVKQISTYQYVDDSGYGYLPVFRSLAAIPKVALGVAAITKSCDDSEYIELWYQLNGAGSWVDLGDFNDSPRDDILTFASGLGVEFHTIQFRIKLIRGSTNTNSPELESLLFYYYATPSRISAWTFNVEAVGEWADSIFTAFETILDTNTLVAFYPSGDTAKTSYKVKLTTMPSREYWEEQGGRQGFFQVSLEEIFKG